jgi:hypothetical protein
MCLELQDVDLVYPSHFMLVNHTSVFTAMELPCLPHLFVSEAELSFCIYVSRLKDFKSMISYYSSESSLYSCSTP